MTPGATKQFKYKYLLSRRGNGGLNSLFLHGRLWLVVSNLANTKIHIKIYDCVKSY